MRKEEQDQILSTMSPEEPSNLPIVLQGIRSEADACTKPGVTRKTVLESRREEFPPGFLAKLDVLMDRDQTGPKEGEPPPDFVLKKLGSEDRVRLSSFRGREAVALAFGSYTCPPFRDQIGISTAASDNRWRFS